MKNPLIRTTLMTHTTFSHEERATNIGKYMKPSLKGTEIVFTHPQSRLLNPRGCTIFKLNVDVATTQRLIMHKEVITIWNPESF